LPDKFENVVYDAPLSTNVGTAGPDAGRWALFLATITVNR
jgi:hypothetical protein